jgi:hypothetical protein
MQRGMRRTLLPLGATVMMSALSIACAAVPPSGTPIPQLPTLRPVAVWMMDEVGGTRMHDLVPPAQNGVLSPGVRPEGGVFEFPGWIANVDSTGHLVGVVSATDGEVVVRDRAHVLEPTHDAFAVSGTIRSRLTAAGQLPLGAPGASFNVIQKARANNRGGFWKVEIGVSGPNRGRLICTIGDGVQVAAVASPNWVGDGAWHAFSCWLGRGVLVAQVDAQGAGVNASQLSTVDPVSRFSGEVVLGKKPGSTDPGDSFAGWLGEVRVGVG